VVEAAARLYLKCAELTKSAGDLKASMGHLRKALEQRPRWVEGWRELAAELAAAGQPEEAAKAWRRVEDIHVEDRQFVEAAAALKEQIRLVPSDPEPRHRLVRLYERTGNREARAAELAELANLLAERDEIEEAVTLYKQLIILRPDDAELLQRYIELFAQVGSELEIVPEYLRLAKAYAQRGRFVEATRTYEQVLAIDRINVEARRQFIDFLLSTGQRSRGVLELRKVAGIYRAAGKYAEAIEALTTAHGLEPDDGDLCMSVAEVCEQAGDQTRALDFYALAAAAYAESFAAKAVRAYTRYLELAPDHVEIRQAFVNLLQKIGDNALLKENARKLASAYEMRGDNEKAEEARKIAASAGEETPEMLRARIEADAGDPKQQYYDWIRLGDLLVERGDVEQGLDAYRKARAINDDAPELIRKYIDALVLIIPEHEAIPDFLALAERYFGVGDYTRAVEVYEHVLKLDPRNSAARSGKHTAERMTKF
jgi:tetratricopeptide (TPR) repeat protein